MGLLEYLDVYAPHSRELKDYLCVQPDEDILRISKGDDFLAWYSSGGHLKLYYGNEQIGQMIDMRGLGIIPNTPDMETFIKDAIQREGYETANINIEWRMNTRSSEDEERFKDAFYYAFRPDASNQIGIMNPYYNIKGKGWYGYFNTTNMPLSFKCRFSYLVARVSDYVDMPSEIMKTPEWSNIYYIIAENNFNFKAVGKHGEVIKHLCIRKKPYNFPNKQGWTFYEGPMYVIGVR